MELNMPSVSVFIERKNIKSMLEADNLTELLKKTEVNPETVLIALNGVLVTKNAIIKDGDEIKLLSVISGG